MRIGPNGEMFVSSDNNNTVLVIRHINPQHRPILIPQVATAGFNHHMIGGPTLASTEFTFDSPPSKSSQAMFIWRAGEGNHMGLAYINGQTQVINASAAANGAGTAAPLLVGGEMSIEAVFRPDNAAIVGDLNVLYEAATPSLSDYIVVGWTLPSGTSAGMNLEVRWVDRVGKQQSVTQPTGVQAYSEWVYVIIALRSNPQTGGVQANIHCHSVDGTSSNTNMVDDAALPAYSPRQSTIGRSYALHASQTVTGFVGAVDTLRLYPYALSTNEALLQFDMSDPHIITPVVWGHFSMQPYESNEAHFTHRGVASHLGQQSMTRQPPPQQELFPGWAHFNGVNQSIDLTNPANGVNGYWVTDVLKGGHNMSLEMWVRPDVDGDYTLLDARPVLRVEVMQGVVQVTWTATDGESNVKVEKAVTVGKWSHLVWTINASTSTVYLNGALALSSPVTGTLVSEAPSHGWLARGEAGGWYYGDIAGFRVYSAALTLTQAARLYLAQMGHAPIPPTPSSSTGGGGGGGGGGVSSSSHAPVTSSTGGGGGESSSDVPMPSSTGEDGSDDGGLSTSTVLLTVGALLVVLVVLGLGYAVYRQKKNNEMLANGGGGVSTTRDGRTALLSQQDTTFY